MVKSGRETIHKLEASQRKARGSSVQKRNLPKLFGFKQLPTRGVGGRPVLTQGETRRRREHPARPDTMTRELVRLAIRME